MILDFDDDIDLEKIALSGQAFRWRKLDDESFMIPAFGKLLVISKTQKGLELDCSEADYQKIWKSYLDMDTSYKKIRAMIDPDDKFLTASGQAGKGIRILRQDSFETLISFIISQRKNIPAIETAIERLCLAFGDPIGQKNGETVCSFPTAERLKTFECKKNGTAKEDLCSYEKAGIKACGLGYRVPYIQSTAGEIAANEAAFAKLDRLSDKNLLDRLMEYKGVGIKVASCTMLFGYHRTDSFPIDVWIKRALDEHYPDGFDFDRYRPYNGIMQQYIFAYYRMINS